MSNKFSLTLWYLQISNCSAVSIDMDKNANMLSFLLSCTGYSIVANEVVCPTLCLSAQLKKQSANLIVIKHCSNKIINDNKKVLLNCKHKFTYKN